MRHLVIILGDQLNRDSHVFDAFDPEQDAVWMAEVLGESQRIWSHKTRTVMFFSAMRHFALQLKQDGLTVHYTALPQQVADFESGLMPFIQQHKPVKLRMAEPGEWGIRQRFTALANQIETPLELLPDRHFVCSQAYFAHHVSQRKQLRLEYFYREMRQQTGLLLTDQGKPLGGKWNFDADNRQSFGKLGPPDHPPYWGFAPDELTQSVIADVEALLPDNPGQLSHFDWPVTPAQAQQALDDFIENRLPWFGQYQDAMWTDQPYLYHARLSAALNLKLIDPLTVCRAAEAAYTRGHADLSAVEGFIRQIIGWREYVRGIYWQFMPEYADKNALKAARPLPAFYWTGDTDMHCLRQVIGQTLQYGYAHHIQRLMVTGLFALLLGVEPQQVHQWYLAVYVDAVEWVELPNTLGMSQFADGGMMASKPYAATGKYIQRMSNYCDQCPYDPAEAVGPKACPFTTLYWDFLMRHETLLRQNPRMALQVRNLDRLIDGRKQAIQQQARQWLERVV
jgi:deoxyribodipyrimidine photolyase-related protein